MLYIAVRTHMATVGVKGFAVLLALLRGTRLNSYNDTASLADVALDLTIEWTAAATDSPPATSLLRH